jgi:(4-(4-[2-(gamma-L-glutamylamino)ethyl]phenoxymethyl)furan-2-yl)methanamine synthase
MNEWFATSADVYRLTNELDAGFDQHDSADHRAKDRAATCARLARLIGRDARDATAADWLDLARTLRSAQLGVIEDNVTQVLAGCTLSVDAPVVAAGCGDFLVREIADRLGRRCIDFDRLLGASGPAARWARVCAPSAAVALLLANEREVQGTRLACGS